MIRFLKNILTGQPGSEEEVHYSSNEFEERKLQVATCTLFIEIAKADSNISNDERKKIISLMEETFKLEHDYIEELMELSEKRMNENDSIYEFTTIINSSFTNEEKFELLKNLWRLIYIDDVLDKYEEHLVKKIGILLNVDYKYIISAKLMVKEEPGE